MVSDADLSYRRAAAYLSRVAEPGCAPLHELVGRVGFVSAAELIRDGEVSRELASATEARAATVEPDADLEAADHAGIRLVTPNDAEWPYFAFSALYHAAGRAINGAESADAAASAARGALLPPLVLWLKGAADLSSVSARSVAVVGARAATAYGEHVAAELCYSLASNDVTIVSGGAYGIDAAAHRGALAADGVTIAVSAGGLDRPYPAGNAAIFERIAENGVLVSERPPGCAPQRQRFLSRNRIIAALGSATLVVEAAHRSGALNTARYARQLGRPVLGVPGPISSAQSAGVHELLRRGHDPAQLVTCASEVLEWTFGGATADGALFDAERLAATSPGGSGSTRALLDQLDPASRSVYDGFPARRAVSGSEIAGLSGRPLAAVAAALGPLVELGLIEPDGIRYRRRTAD